MSKTPTRTANPEYAYRSRESLESLPALHGDDGYQVQLTNDHLQLIEELTAHGSTVEYCAMKLGVSVGAFIAAVEHFPRINEAIKRGVLQDAEDVKNVVRAKALEGNLLAAIWYQKNQFPDNWKDNRDKGPANVAIIQVNTNIIRNDGACSDGTTDQPVLDGDLYLDQDI